MKKTSLTSVTPFQLLKGAVLAVVFLLIALILFLFFREDDTLSQKVQQWVYPIGMAGLLAALGTAVLAFLSASPGVRSTRHGPLFYPVLSGVLGLVGMSLAYAYLGMWPVGEKSGMTVDMHWQYAPLLAELRDMLLNGGSPLYSFEVGLGTSFLPLFGYYLASPFNLLLIFFPENLLTEGILVITLLKNALSAAFFAACVQYVYRRRDISVPIVSVMYALMMYVLAYNWNIMWLDCVMILPLVVLGFERLMRTGRFLPYVLTLAYALYANYYIGFMICVFMVLYYLAYALRARRGLEKQAGGFARFAIGSALGGGLAMFLLVPVAMALGQTSAAGGTLPDMNANFDMFNLLGRHLYGTTPTIRSGNLPNIDCGLLAVFLLPIFATLRSIPLRRRITYMGLLAVMGLSFVLNQMDLLWHGLHAPNDLPYRFSFLYSFVLLLIAFEALMHLREISFKQIALTFVGILAYILIEERFGDEAYGFTSIYISLLLVAIYAVVTALVSRRRLTVRPAYALLLLIVTAEMTFQAGDTYVTLNSTEYFTNHDAYVDNTATQAIREAVEKAEDYGDQQAGGAFYRLEKLPRKTCVDPALFHYRGLSVFASSNSYKATRFMGSLGYAINGVNSYLYNSFVAPVDSLFGIRYLVLDVDVGNHPQLKMVDSVHVEDITYYIYENTTALPVAYRVDDEIKGWTADSWSPLTSQSGLLSAMTGNDADLYEFQRVEVDYSSMDIASINGIYSFSINPTDTSTTTSAEFRVPISGGGQGFLYVDCGAAENISVAVTGQDGYTARSNWEVSPGEPYIIDAGTLQDGDTVNVTIGADSAVTGNIYVALLNDDVFNQAIQKLSADGLQVTSFTDSRIEGTLNASESGTVFTSIPYDSGWTVKVDGKRVETFGIAQKDLQGDAGAMLGFDIEAGTHTVELSFFPRGLWIGIAISVVSLVLLVFIVLATRKSRVPAAVGAGLPADGPAPADDAGSIHDGESPYAGAESWESRSAAQGVPLVPGMAEPADGQVVPPVSDTPDPAAQDVAPTPPEGSLPDSPEPPVPPDSSGWHKAE